MISSSRQAGFALIEVLAALVLTMMLVAVVLPFAGRLLTHWWIGEPVVERMDAFMQAVSRLGDDVAQAVPMTMPAGGRQIRIFQGDAAGLDFIRPALGADGGLSLDVVSYRIQHGEGGDRLLRYAMPYAPGRPLTAILDNRPPNVLIDEPWRFSFSVIGRDGARPSSWQSQTAMPLRVEFTAKGPGTPAGAMIVLPVVATGE